jgi:hypothetical protein
VLLQYGCVSTHGSWGFENSWVKIMLFATFLFASLLIWMSGAKRLLQDTENQLMPRDAITIRDVWAKIEAELDKMITTISGFNGDERQFERYEYENAKSIIDNPNRCCKNIKKLQNDFG